MADVLTGVADRFALEIAFRDLKDVVGADQQQGTRPANHAAGRMSVHRGVAR